MTRRALQAHLRSHGCVQLRDGARHAIWANPAVDLRAPVPRHREIPTGTALRSAGNLPSPHRPGADRRELEVEELLDLVGVLAHAWETLIDRLAREGIKLSERQLLELPFRFELSVELDAQLDADS